MHLTQMPLCKQRQLSKCYYGGLYKVFCGNTGREWQTLPGEWGFGQGGGHIPVTFELNLKDRWDFVSAGEEESFLGWENCMGNRCLVAAPWGVLSGAWVLKERAGGEARAVEGHLLKGWVLSQVVLKSLKVFKQRGATISPVLQTVLLAALQIDWKRRGPNTGPPVKRAVAVF